MASLGCSNRLNYGQVVRTKTPAFQTLATRTSVPRKVTSARTTRQSVILAAKREPAPAPGEPKTVKVPSPKLDVDLNVLVQYNFFAQVALTGISWAVVFFTSHAALAKGAGINPTVFILLVGVALAGYSAYLSFQYLTKVQKGGLDVLQGWKALKDFNDHMTVNFIGAFASLLALQAEVGSLLLKSLSGSSTVKAAAESASQGIEALAQAATNSIFAHLISIIFLTIFTHKIMNGYKKWLEWSEKLRSDMPTFG